VQIQKQVALRNQLLDNFNNLIVDIARLIFIKAPVHVSIYASLIENNGMKIGAWNNDQVAFIQHQIGIQIRRQIAARLISLDTAQDKDGIPIETPV